jgi:hypothetical protein
MTRSKNTVPQPTPADNGETDSLGFPFGANQLEESDAPSDMSAADETPTAAVPASQDTPDPFDPVSLRLPQDFSASLGVKKALLSVPVRKPDKSWWVRVHPDQDYRLQTAVIELKEDRETYLVAPSLWRELAAEATFSPRALHAAVNRQGVLFVWPIRLPGADGKLDEWSRTAHEAAERATRGWVRVTANLSLGAYDVLEAVAQLGEPDWPVLPFRELLRVAFRDKLIDSLDHPVLRRLRGEA